MQPASISLLKKSLTELDPPELIELCLRLAKYKKESKELLSYLIFDDKDKGGFVQMIKLEIDDDFEEINTSSYYYIKKSVRKVLRNVKKYIRFTQSKEVEVELLLYWCQKMREVQPPVENNMALSNLYDRQIQLIKKAIAKLNEDLRYDYNELLSEYI